MISYQWAQLISGFGGVVGIWIGISVISIMEVFGLIIELIIVLFGKYTIGSMDDDEEEILQPDDIAECSIPRNTTTSVNTVTDVTLEDMSADESAMIVSIMKSQALHFDTL